MLFLTREYRCPYVRVSLPLLTLKPIKLLRPFQVAFQLGNRQRK